MRRVAKNKNMRIEEDIVIGGNRCIFYSENGKFIKVDHFDVAHYMHVIYANNRWYAIDGSPREYFNLRLLSSVDKINWELVSVLPTTGRLFRFKCLNNILIACNDYGGCCSSDWGMTWQKTKNDYQAFDVEYDGKGTYYFVQASGIIETSDFVNYPSGPKPNFKYIAYGNGLFKAWKGTDSYVGTSIHDLSLNNQINVAPGGAGETRPHIKFFEQTGDFIYIGGSEIQIENGASVISVPELGPSCVDVAYKDGAYYFTSIDGKLYVYNRSARRVWLCLDLGLELCYIALKP